MDRVRPRGRKFQVRFYPYRVTAGNISQKQYSLFARRLYLIVEFRQQLLIRSQDLRHEVDASLLQREFCEFSRGECYSIEVLFACGERTIHWAVQCQRPRSRARRLRIGLGLLRKNAPRAQQRQTQEQEWPRA